MASRLAAVSLLLFAAVGCTGEPEGLAVSARTESGSLVRWTSREIVTHLAPERPGAAESLAFAHDGRTLLVTDNRVHQFERSGSLDSDGDLGQLASRGVRH